MGINVPVARAILKEHKVKPITGDGLLVGRQTVPLTVSEAKALIVEEGVALRNIDPLLDTTTGAAAGHNWISDIGFFALFSDVKLRTLDVTDYEGAEIVHDMHLPIPRELENSFDFIWNGSCLDNMFDPAQAMRNTGRMLKAGGRVILMEMGSPHFNAYSMFSHCWFFDYFAINEYKNCKVYSCVFDPADIWDGPFDVYIPANYDAASCRQFPMEEVFRSKALISLSIAEASENTTWEKMPIQGQYRPDHTVYKAAYERFGASAPMTATKQAQNAVTSVVVSTNGFQYLGTLDAVKGERRFKPSKNPVTRLRNAIDNPSRVITKLFRMLKV